MSWMIYGANGYTGRLTAEEAVRRGLRRPGRPVRDPRPPHDPGRGPPGRDAGRRRRAVDVGVAEPDDTL
mgnify:CR=1 FL=1